MSCRSCSHVYTPGLCLESSFLLCLIVLQGKETADKQRGRDVLRSLNEEFGVKCNVTESDWLSVLPRCFFVNKYIVDRVCAGMKILKRCRTDDEREDFHVACGLVAPTKATAQVAQASRATRASGREVADRLGVRRLSGRRAEPAVFEQGTKARAAMDTAEANYKEALKVGDKVVCASGTGILTAIGNETGMDRSCEVSLAHGSVKFASMGRGKGGGRVRRAPATLRPLPKAKKKNAIDVKAPEVKANIDSFLRAECPTSPCRKDTATRRLARNVTEKARIMWRFRSWDELWQKFRKVFVASAKIIEGKDKDKCPRYFRENSCWELRKGGGASCLCANCEGMEKYTRGRKEVARLLQCACLDHSEAEDITFEDGEDVTACRGGGDK